MSSTYVAVLSTADLAERWQITPATVINWWRTEKIPAPINPKATRRYRWAVATIEQFETAQQQVAS